MPTEGCFPLRVGLSGHVGETGFDFLTPGPPPLNLPPSDDERFETWSANVDFHIPMDPRYGVQGEVFVGANLSPFLGGIGQGVCPCFRELIRSIGGWFELWYELTEQTTFHLGFGVDDPDDDDSLVGRIYNQFIFANLIVDITDHLSTGLELAYWKTLYHETRVGLVPPDELTPSEPGKAMTIGWMVNYSF